MFTSYFYSRYRFWLYRGTEQGSYQWHPAIQHAQPENFQRFAQGDEETGAEKMKRHQPGLSTHPNLRGFTLVEMAVVVAIIALMISGMMVPMAVMLDQRKYNETADLLAAANDAVVGFAANHGRLPCPDRIGSDGTEDCNLAAQDTDHAWGDLPSTTLGVIGFDAWGNRFRYSVYPQLTVEGRRFADIGAAAQLSVRCSSLVAATGAPGHIPGCHNAAGTATELTATASFLIISSGINGLGAVSASGTTFPNPPAANADEIKNVVALGANPATRRIFVSRIRTDIGTPAGEFDDVLSWMSASQLTALMQKAGQWPPTPTTP